MRRRRGNQDKPREKRTLIPSFDPQVLAKAIEQEQNCTTVAPPFDPSSYARIVEQGSLDTPRPMAPDDPRDPSEDDTLQARDIDAETIGREMYGCYLASEFPSALVLAERVLEREPTHALAQLVATQCRERLQPSARTLSPSSVLRLKAAALEQNVRHIDATSTFVLGHVDGISNAATVAALSGLPDTEALNRLHALVDLGVLEVVSA